jgi:ribonuclease HI
MSIIQVWTDGSANPNPGKGSWAFILVDGNVIIGEGAGFESGPTTNNRMEFLALIKAFEYIEREEIQEKCVAFDVYSDSNLMVQTFNIWMDKWRSHDWRRYTRGEYKEVSNLDLVKDLHRIKHTFEVKMRWVKAHAGQRWNERCDTMCREEFRKRGLKSFEDIKDDYSRKYC